MTNLTVIFSLNLSFLSFVGQLFIKMLQVNFICEMAEIWEIAVTKSHSASLIFPVLKIIQMNFTSKNEAAYLGY